MFVTSGTFERCKLIIFEYLNIIELTINVSGYLQ